MSSITDTLTHCYNSFNETHKFAPGDITQWKPNMRHKKATGPFIVMEVLPNAIIDESESTGSPYYREPTDLVVGYLHDEYGFMLFHMDSRRLEPYTE